MTALIQFGTRSCVFLIDPHSAFAGIKKYLKPILEDGTILKVFHGMPNDYKNLMKDFNIHLVGVTCFAKTAKVR